VTLSHTPFCSKSKIKEKEKKRNINNNLAILPSHDTFLDSGATRSFIDRDFIHLKGINIQTLLCNIPVFNVNSSPNEAGQISEVIDILLCYKTHFKRMLLAISGLGKQSLILGYNWLKDHNPKID